MRKIWKNKQGVSPVIAVILMVAITVVLAAVLYAMVSIIIPETEITERGSLVYEIDSNIPGKYKIEFQGSVACEKIEIKIYDTSADLSALIDTPKDGDSVSVGQELLNITYDDVNENLMLDGADTLIVRNGDAGDKVTIINKSTGETIAALNLK